MVAETFVTAFTERMIPLINELEPSFFEITVAMAFDWFEQQQVDVAVIETGLGGRLDSTNVITPVLSVITNIGWDHMALLGSTLPAIAFEKAGIIKDHVPAVIGEVHAETRPVFEQAARNRKAPLHFAEEEWTLVSHNSNERLIHIELREHATEQNFCYDLDLTGLYQIKNLRTVLTAVRQLQKQGWTIKEDELLLALKNVQQQTGLQGRWEVIRYNPLLILDVGHNEDGMRQIVHQLQQMQFEKLHIILGMVKDKEIEKVLSLLPLHASYYFTRAHLPRALPAIELKEKAHTTGLKGAVYEDVNTAIKTALQQAGTNDLLLVCGSVFLVGEVKKELFRN